MYMRRCVHILLLFIASAMLPASALFGAEQGSDPAHKVDFNADVRPIFNRHCLACHGGVKQAAGISFIRRATALAPAESGEAPIVPGDPDHSELIRRIKADDDERMPPADHGRRLSDQEIATLGKWISEGAEWRDHWAYVKPVPPSVPAVHNQAWCQQPLDRFVLARLDAEGLQPAPPADRRAWLRRVTFDLTGLPPTLDALHAYLADDSADAEEKVVDRLLASPAYGERWAAMWLDLARYADTVGFERDPPRNVWHYRDWLIRALNDDVPFDRFTIKQLAGDLLPEPQLDDLVATAFHRNTQNNTEGGTDDEEFRVQAVIDRINTTWQVWQGTTFGCTQCHSHPYAPFDNDEYYKCMAFFNTTSDCDVDEDFPLLDVPLDPADFAAAAKLDRRASALRQELFGRFNAVATPPEQWNNLAADKVRSTGSAKLRTRTVDNRVEVLAEGTISTNPTYSIESPVPAGMTQLTALRIEVLPLDVQAALRTPESGFMLSELKGFVLRPGEKRKEFEFALVMCDEAHPVFDPQDSLDKDVQGWAAYSRISRPVSAVFVLKNPLMLAADDRLLFELGQRRRDVGLAALVIRRAIFSVSASDAWGQLLGDERFTSAREELTTVRAERDKIHHSSVPFMQELVSGSSRHTYQFERGNWLNKTTEVSADTPAALPRLPADAPRNRLALAEWLVSADNPLTARVMANRLWAELFGVGLVETAEDFGPAGTAPSHPELLDYLSCRFQYDDHWSTKRLLRELVLSATYRQDSVGMAELRKRDPMNRLLARGPRNRLTAEMVRDQALVASGLLSDTMYGPPVMPPQPEGVWRNPYNGRNWKTAEGPDRYRRGLYTYWKRTSGYPSFMAFDSPSREVCTVRRIATNTPLQALATLNDEAYIEFARGLAGRMANDSRTELRDQLKWAYEAVTSREPAAASLDDLTTLYREALEIYKTNADESSKLGASAEEAARAVVCNAIFNLDGALIK